MNEILKEYFGYDKLKDKQEEIIKSLLAGNDTIGVLATGYGKSICYQLPYNKKKKTVIVISPLISLMEDQKLKLEKLDIPVYCFNSNNNNKNFDKYDLLNGRSGIIYLSPEYIMTCPEFIKELSENDLISLVAIDESHCISTWSDFRPEYKDLKLIKEWVGDIPMLALTASATPKIINDIKNVLELDNPKIVMSSFYRKNLNVNVIKKYNKDFDIKEIVELIKKLGPNDKSIIYCKTKDETDDLVVRLKNFNIKSKGYHAGKTNKYRNKVQYKFTNGNVNVIIATIAFGMGIDVPNIRLIVNYGISKDMESFYQEMGRAGRDGLKSDIYLYWSKRDFNINKSFLNSIKDNNFKKKQMGRILEMEKFVNNNGCRMKYITNYFGEKMDNCGHCDNCLSEKIEYKNDITKECFYILKTVKKLKSNFGTTMISEIVYGSNSKKIKAPIKKLSVFGKLNNFKKDRIKEIIRYLVMNDYLVEEKLERSFGSVIKISNNGYNWISKNKVLDEILEDSKIYESVYRTEKQEIVEDNGELENKLKAYRKRKANEENRKLYQIFPNKTIEQLLTIKIKNLNDLQKINGMGTKRIEKYGKDIINIVSNNPLEDTPKQDMYNKLLEAGLSIDEINNFKQQIIKEQLVKDI